MASCDLDTYLDGLAYQLKDCAQTSEGNKKHVRWTRDHLIWIICIAASQLKSDRGDLFLTDKLIKLTAGCYTLTCEQGCEFVKRPFRFQGKECEEITQSSSSDSWANSFFTIPACSSTDDNSEYTIDSVEVDIDDPCIIKVSPPVPDDGIQRHLIVRCSEDPTSQIQSGILPHAICNNAHAFTQLVLSYAYGMDSMINGGDGASSQSDSYHEKYIDLMKLSRENRLSLLDDRVIQGQLTRLLGES